MSDRKSGSAEVRKVNELEFGRSDGRDRTRVRNLTFTRWKSYVTKYKYMKKLGTLDSSREL